LWVAAFGPKAVEQAGRLGLPYLASPIESLAALEANYARHREALAGVAVAVPVMRTLFVSRHAARVERARAGLAQQAAALAKAPASSLRRAAAAAVDDWAIVGSPDEVAEGMRRYREKLGVTHLIARVQIPGLAREEIEASLHEIAAISF
jgi:alkanesulfonate monooxygenase SsuD/methylene tetrahydromethanopterin reductase-like flavin-dependent oxidoreductase (luciferase family)